jgi:hypothetical protein
VSRSRYEVLAPIARGGMGEVLLARRVGPAGFEKLVVLKRPLAAASGSQALVAALVEEARLLARINHQNVCQVHDLEEADGEFFLTLEYLEGLPLWSLLGAGNAAQPFDARVVCAIGEQACDGLDAIHAAGVVHRDISPSNLFLTEGGLVKILDLGIAKASESEDHTPFGRVKGKLPYLSPEQCAGRSLDGRADLFALAIVLHDLAAGCRPPEDRVGALAELQLAAVPAPLAEVIQAAAATAAHDRFGSAKQMASALRAAAQQLGGVVDRAELAAWLAARCGAELARRRARFHGAAGTAPELTSATRADSPLVTRVLETRSALGTSPGDARHTETLPPTGAAPAAWHTESLPRTDDGSAQVVARAETAAPRPRRSIAIAVSAAFVVIVGVVGMRVLGQAEGPRASGLGPRGNVETEPAPPESVVVARSAGEASPPVTAPPLPPAVPQVQPPPHAPPTRAPATHAANHPRRVETPGNLTVDSRPFATIRIGARNLGPTPVWRASLAPGRYRVHATASDGREQDVTVQIEEGRERRLVLDWSKP